MRFGYYLLDLSRLNQANYENDLYRIRRAGYRYLEPVISMRDDSAQVLLEWLARNRECAYKWQIDCVEIREADPVADAEKIAELAGTLGVRQIAYRLPSGDRALMGLCDGRSEERQEEVGAPEGGSGEKRSKTENLGMIAGALCALSNRLAENGIELLLAADRECCAVCMDGRTIFESLLEACSGKVRAQVNVGWLLAGGTDPESFLWAHEELVGSVHYRYEKNGERLAADNSLLDEMAIFQFARYAEVIQYLDDTEGDTLSRDAVFENAARIRSMFGALSSARERTRSILCSMDIQTGEVRELQTFDGVIEAPNWYQQDPDYIFYNADGRIFRYRISTGESVMLESGKCTNCNNDHVISSDGREIAVSHSDTGWLSKVYIFPIEGGQPREITPNFPSFLHGWSNDRKELAYCAFRGSGEDLHVDIYTIPYEGGEEKALTQNAGFNDGPEYSPDDAYILFISTRSGLMQNWRMRRDGSGQEQLTFSERNNWFGHYSPDGKKIVYLSYSRDGLDPNEHLPNMKVQLGLMNADGSDDHVIYAFFGGQGSINVNSWNPDSRRFAFVKYELEHK